jgi:hypothetical protein
MFARDRPAKGSMGLRTSAEIKHPSIAKYADVPAVGTATNPGNFESPFYNQGFHERNVHLQEAYRTETGVAPAITNEIAFIARIPLKYVHDFFNQLGLSWGIGWKFSFMLNTGSAGKIHPLTIGSCSQSAGANVPDYAGTLSISVAPNRHPRLYYHNVSMTVAQTAAASQLLAAGYRRSLIFKTYTVTREQGAISRANGDRAVVQLPSQVHDGRAIYLMAYPTNQVGTSAWPSVLVTGANGMTDLNVQLNNEPYLARQLQTPREQYEALRGLMSGGDERERVNSESLISYRDFLRNNRILALDITRHQKRLVNPALGVTVVVEGTVQSQEPVELVFVTESLKRVDLVLTSHEAQAFIRNRINE